MVVVADDRLKAEETMLTVMSYNIHHGQGLDGKIDLPRIAQLIADSKADLVTLQEVDNKAKRSGSVDQTAELARLTGMHGYFGKQMDFDGGEYGQAILSRFPLSETTVHMLPRIPKTEQRVAVSAAFTAQDTKMVIVTAHLSYENTEIRMQQVEVLNTLQASWKRPTILTGDLNDVPDQPAIQALHTHWKTTAGDEKLLTFPARRPNRQIDYIFVSPDFPLATLRAQVIDEAVASDHRPLLVEFQ